MDKTDKFVQISVIIPVYNAEKYISHCLNSLINQGISNYSIEILVIDDGSTDNSIVIARKFQKTYPYIKIYSQENGGIGSARNKGVELAMGEFIYFIDADDYLVDNGLKMIFDNLGKTKADLVCFNSTVTPTYNLNKLIVDLNSDDYGFDVLDGISYIGKYGFKSEAWWYLINRKFLQDINLKFNEGVWVEDAVYTANLLVNAKAVYFAPLSIHRHVTVPNSVMTNKDSDHYKKVIYDIANNAVEYDRIIKRLAKNNKNFKAINKLEIRKQSFSFFLIIRAVKSKISYNELALILKRMEAVKAYPISKSFLTEYKGLHYRILRIILNNKVLLYVSSQLFR